MIFSKKIQDLALEAESALTAQYKHIDEVAFRNTQKVMEAFRNHRVSDACFQSTSGYGYDDRGREVLEEVWADVMGAEAAVVRHTIISGTHALSTGLFGILRPGDVMYSVAGKPYDTLEEVIGISGTPGNGSLKDFGVDYEQTDLTPDGTFNFAEIEDKLRVLVDAVKAAEHELKADSITAAMKSVIPTFYSPEEINKTAAECEEMNNVNEGATASATAK